MIRIAKIAVVKALCLLVLAGLLTSCTANAPKEEKKAEAKQAAAGQSIPGNFEMIDEVKSETAGKAQLLEYALYNDSVYTEAALKNTLMAIYNLNNNKEVFLSHDHATVIGIYLFTSKKAYEDKSNWIAMLMKGPSDSQPNISYNSFKVHSLNDQQDNIKSKDELTLEKLNRDLSKRGLELCSLNAQLLKMEQDHIDQADAAYPDFGPEHLAMVDRLDEKAYGALKGKYNLSDDILTKVHVFAMSYCK